MYYIYRITNLVNGKTYIGQHKYKDINDKYIGSGKVLKQAYKKYGIENFKKEILVFNVARKEHADLLEKTFIASEREKVGIENCYNIADGGQGGNLGDEVNKKKSEVMKGRTPWDKGKHLSEETKQKIAEAHKGFRHSEESRKKMSEAHKGKLKGKKHGPMSEETKRKISDAMKGTFKGQHWKLVDGKRVYFKDGGDE